MELKELEKKTKAYALKNAISHEGQAMMGPVISSLFHEGLSKAEAGKYGKRISEIIGKINTLSAEEQKKEFEKLEKTVSERESREGLEELPDVPKTGIITRFRPSPSGPLHVGHIISNLPSSLYVEKYGGKFYIIIDDTDPETAIAEAYEQIKKDCDWIFGNVTEYINSSDRMDVYYDYAEKLIGKGDAYVCTCSSEKFKKLAEKKKNCPCRKKTTKKNQEEWKKMLDEKGFREGGAVLRFKTPAKLGGMKHPNPAMRDFPLARICLHEHTRQEKKYRVWPLMNLVVAVDDMEFRMTHIIRGKDHMDNAKRQKMIFDVFKKKYPWAFFIGRIKFKDLALSKRKIAEGIKSGKYSGTEDEKLPTISSLRKRGYKPEAFAKFVEQRGLTEVDKVIDSSEFFKIIDNFGREL